MMALLGALSLSACASAVADVGSLGAGATAHRARDVQIFVDSTRPLKADGAADGSAHFSLATVSVPAAHEAGGLEMASFGSPNRASDFAVVGRRSLEAETFRNEVATHLSGRIGSNRDVLVFVHGFNTGFDEARFRLAQIVTDGDFNGVPVLFTWPSKGSLFGYASDREAATASRDALEHLLLDLAALPDIGKVHVLAHSMGAWLAMEALREVAIAGHPDLDGHLGDIILAAPDIDQGVFRQQVERLGGGTHISVFAATNDRALTLSGILADRPRLGAIDASSPDGRQALEGLGVHVIDLTRDSVGIIGHATYASAPEVIRGIGAEIGAARPADRERQAVLGGEPSAPVFEPAPPPVVATPLPAAQPPAIAVP
ncbi:MAG: alpha/beta hydrolase [Janthinobacterium lividum]